jgi:NAD(P)-dependent dehydrogenase (short-subunit alcohol dehydrogenase family)
VNLELENKVVIVTGGARGIGEATVRSFAAEGAIVAIVDRSGDSARHLADELVRAGRRATAHECELTDEAAVRATIGRILQSHGRLDVVVNNAGANDGVGLRAPIADFRGSLERNLIPCLVVVQAALDALIAARGTVVNVGTKCALTGQGGTSGYVAAKGALHALTREWALDLSAHGVRVNAVVPAEVYTPLYEQWLAQRPDPAAALAQVQRLVPLGHRLTTPQEIADTIVFLASARSSHTTGQLVHVDGGYVHFDRAASAGPAA